jgi:hypothetical protein
MSAITDFFDVILRGESRTYDDHNWYVSGGRLRGYIKGRNTNPYPLLKKDLSKYSFGEIKAFQSRDRDANGQLWATGRYQIIPSTLRGVQKQVGLPDSAIYNLENQDKLGFALLVERRNTRNYLYGKVPDTLENRQLAALDVAKVWSSVGVPYRVFGGRGRYVEKDESYYKGGGDKASVPSINAQQALQKLRNSLLNNQVPQAPKIKRDFTWAYYISGGLLLSSAIAFYFIAKRRKNK